MARGERKPAEVWNKAMNDGLFTPRQVIAVSDALAIGEKFDEVVALLKANLRQGVLVQPCVFDALALALRASGGSPEEIERGTPERQLETTRTCGRSTEDHRLMRSDGTLLDVTSAIAIVFDDDGVREFFGGYDDWLRQRKAPPARREQTPAARAPARSVREAAASKRKLSFKEQQELSRLPATIENCEAEIAELHRVMSQPSFYQQPGAQIAAEQARLKELEGQLADCYQRWEELEQHA